MENVASLHVTLHFLFQYSFDVPLFSLVIDNNSSNSKSHLNHIMCIICNIMVIYNICYKIIQQFLNKYCYTLLFMYGCVHEDLIMPCKYSENYRKKLNRTQGLKCNKVLLCHLNLLLMYISHVFLIKPISRLKLYIF